MTQAAHSLLMYHFSLSTYLYSFKIKTKQQIFSDFVVSVIFWADACTTQYEFIIACQNLLKSANVSRSYSKNKTDMFFMDRSVEGNTFFAQFNFQRQ